MAEDVQALWLKVTVPFLFSKVTTSAVAGVSPSSLTSQVSTVTLSSPRSAARFWIFSRCVELFETAVIDEFG